MDPSSTNSAWNLAQTAQSLLRGITWSKFLVAFIPAFVGTGLLFGIVYILLSRALKINRRAVEEWFEAKRARLQAGPVPILELAVPLMIGVLDAIYGRTMKRRFLASGIMAGIFSAVLFSILLGKYHQLPLTIREEKSLLERNLDPFLYRYATDPALAAEYAKAFERVRIWAGLSSAFDLKYNGEPYKKIREHNDKYNDKLVRAIASREHSFPLMLLLLFEGNYLSPGFRFFDVLLVFCFNVIMDFISITIIVHSLRRLKLNYSILNCAGKFTAGCFGTIACLGLAFVSYRMFFSGNTSFFVQLLLLAPLSILGVTISLPVLVAFAYAFRKWFRNRTHSRLHLINSILRFRISSVIEAAAFFSGCFCVGSYGILHIWNAWHLPVEVAWRWRDLISIPYVLALTTLVPAFLSMAAFGLLFISKATGEPLRLVSYAYLTFVKEEVGGSQASGIILVIGVIAGVLAGLLVS